MDTIEAVLPDFIPSQSPVLATPPETLAVVPGPEDESPALIESKLPDDYHEAYKLRLAGVPVGQIAAKFGVCRETIWRWAKAVESEFIEYLEKNPTFNIIAEQFKRLRDLEEENRRAAAAEKKSGRAKAMFLMGALKAVQAQNDLLLDVGIFERAPERLFKVVANVKPPEPEKAGPRPTRSKEQVIAEMFDRLSKSTQL